MTVDRRRRTLQRIDQMTIELELELELERQFGHSRRCRKVTTYLKQLKQMDGAHEADQLQLLQLHFPT